MLACRSICGASSTILWTFIWMNSSKESSCWRTRPFSSKYEEMTIQQACGNGLVRIIRNVSSHYIYLLPDLVGDLVSVLPLLHLVLLFVHGKAFSGGLPSVDSSETGKNLKQAAVNAS
jgi:hypothetical protein